MKDRRLAGRRFTNVDDLEEAVRAAWAHVDQEWIDNTVLGIYRRLDRCAQLKGANIGK